MEAIARMATIPNERFEEEFAKIEKEIEREIKKLGD
jgi:hypothetical protein